MLNVSFLAAQIDLTPGWRSPPSVTSRTEETKGLRAVLFDPCASSRRRLLPIKFFFVKIEVLNEPQKSKLLSLSIRSMKFYF